MEGFEILRPQLLAYIFDILVKVLQVKQKGGIKISNGLNRMADFEEYAEIISRCMGYHENEFLRVYQDNIGVQIDEAIQANHLSMVVMELMDNKEIGDELDKTPTELHLELNDVAENQLKINIQKIPSWPKSPNQLSRRLNEIKTNLREKGIVIEKYKDEKGHRKIKIRKVSSISPYRQDLENQAQSQNKSLDDTLDDTFHASSTHRDNNQAQNNGFGRLDGIDNTLHEFQEKDIEVKNDDDANAESIYECYYCDKFIPTIEEVNYQKHVISSHPTKRLYPSLSELKEMRIKLKGKRWEI